MLDWFTTIPGILIICGVLLLIIAIILFVVGARKNKKKEVVDKSNLNVNDSSVNAVDLSNVNDNVNLVTNDGTNFDSSNLESTNDTGKSDNGIDALSKTSDNLVVNNEITIDSVSLDESNSNSNQQSIENSSEDLEKTEVISIPDFDENNEDKVSVYGGATPTYNFTEDVKPVTIYGGNDPLEATQALPKMEDAHIPYGGVSPDNKIVDFNMQDNNIVQPEITPVEVGEKPIEINESSDVIIPTFDDSVSNNNTSFLDTKQSNDTLPTVNTTVNENTVSVVEEL